MTTTDSYRRFINRPNNETPLLLRYREAHGGTLLLEYPPPITRMRDAATRKVDAVFLPDTPSIATCQGETNVYDWELAPPHERGMLDHLVATSKTVVLQAKNSALGPYLLGQAYFSARLINSEVGVAIAGSSTPELLRVARKLSVKVVHDPLAKSSPETRGLLKPDKPFVERFHRHVEGSLVDRRASRSTLLASTGLVVDDIIIQERSSNVVADTLTSIRGERVIAICSTTQRLGMYVMGAAVCAQLRLLELGAAHAEVAILCKKSDSALAPLLREHAGITVITGLDS